MISIRRSEERGPTRLGWLDSRHSFSFGQYYDPEHMGISVLRVLNDDAVIPGGGFAAHSHQDMEIISFVLSGVIEHKDSMGNIERLPAGEFQLMSAGTGVTHSEYNPSADEPLRFLQIWVLPNRLGITPGYQQQRFPDTDGRQLVISPDGRDGTLKIHQDAFVEHVCLASGDRLHIAEAAERISFLHLIAGRLDFAENYVEAGDGVTVAGQELKLLCGHDAEALLFDLPAL